MPISDYEVVIGLEIHAQLNTNTKLFCPSGISFGQSPNQNVTPVSLGLPGALPVLNEKTVELAVIAGLSLNCEIQEKSIFARKNYFYPDLPKGYQISQFDLPICLDGHLTVATNDGDKRIGITRIHMEEDAGKLVHQGADAIAGADYSLVDLNRAGVPLIEIVSEPDIRSAHEARRYVETLREILLYAGVCQANMEKGQLRVDANVSIRPHGASEFGTRTETKNLNSFRSIEAAINYEISRQVQVIESGGEIVQETRNYDDASGKTTSLRSKADAHDYRYFPDPDLKPLILSAEYISTIQQNLPEHALEKRQRFATELSLLPKQIDILFLDKDLVVFFEMVLKRSPSSSPQEVCKWVLGDLSALLNEVQLTIFDSKVTPELFSELMSLIQSGKVSGKMAKSILESVFKTGKSPQDLLKEQGGEQISDSSELQAMVDAVLDENLDVVEKVKAGKTKSADFLMGQVMKKSRGRAKPDLVRSMILSSIDAR